MQWREDFVTSYVERYLPQQGITAAPIQLRRFCSMLAHQQGGTVNLSKLAGSLGIDGKTARRYLDLLEGLYLVRSLPPWTRNAGKRLVKSAKVYWRDSGILHTLAGLQTLEQVLGHPLCGASWEGYCIEQILNRLPTGATASHYRTHAGAEVDLVIEHADGRTLAVEIKRTLSPKVTPGLVESMETLGSSRGFIVIPEGDAYPLSKAVTAAGLQTFLESPI
jgi:predicted AAA+ superfamily ATPase